MRFATGNRMLAVGLVVTMMAAGACSSKRDDDASKKSTDTTTAQTSGGALSIDTSKCESYNGTEGVTDDTVKIGTSLPLSGIYATAFAPINKGSKAYFDYVNSKGGVLGHKIELVSMDDEYNAGKTRENVDALIQKDKVFATFSIVGTANNLSFRDDYNAVDSQCVPNMFAATGSEKWGETAEYPWIIGSLPAYATEAATFVEYLKAEKPNAKIGLLKQNDDFGESYENALKKAVEGTDITIVATESFNAGDQDPTPQVTALSTSGADTFFVGITGLPCASALKAGAAAGDWKPTTYLSLTCTSQIILNIASDAGKNPQVVEGVIGTGYLQDPADPQFDDSPGMKEFKTEAVNFGIVEKDFQNGYVAFGWLAAEMMVKTMEQAGTLDRKAVMEAAYSLDGVKIPLLRDGISITTAGGSDPFPIESLFVLKYDTSVGQWVQQGELHDFEGRTSEYVG